MNKQYVKKYKNEKKSCLMMRSTKTIARRGDNVSTVQRKEGKEGEKGFLWDSHVTVHGLPNGHAHFPWDSFIVSLHE